MAKRPRVVMVFEVPGKGGVVFPLLTGPMPRGIQGSLYISVRNNDKKNRIVKLLEKKEGFFLK